MIVHCNPETRSGSIYLLPEVQVFSETWFEWLEKKAPRQMDFYISDGQWDDDKLCSVEKIEGVWQVKYVGFKGVYHQAIGPSTEFSFYNFWTALQWVKATARKEEGSLRRQF